MYKRSSDLKPSCSIRSCFQKNVGKNRTWLASVWHIFQGCWILVLNSVTDRCAYSPQSDNDWTDLFLPPPLWNLGKNNIISIYNLAPQPFVSQTPAALTFPLTLSSIICLTFSYHMHSFFSEIHSSYTARKSWWYNFRKTSANQNAMILLAYHKISNIYMHIICIRQDFTNTIPHYYYYLS